MEFDIETVTAMQDLIASQHDAQKKLVDHAKKQTRRMDEIEARLGAPDGHGTKENRMFSQGDYKTLGERLTDVHAEMMESLKRSRRYIFDAKGMFPTSENKTVVDSAAVGFATPGVIGVTRIVDTVTQPRRKLMVSDLLRHVPVTGSQVEELYEQSFTSLASPQTESQAKAESTFALSVRSARVATIAHFVNVSKQLLSDLPGFSKYINETMLHFVLLKLENEILTGDALGNHLNGITTQATATGTTYDTASDTRIDRLRKRFQTDLEVANENCTAFVVNPVDWGMIETVKDESGGANVGQYIVGDPVTGGLLRVPTLWGKPVCVTNAMPVGKALAGDFSKAVLAVREDATVDISFEHASNFTSNLATILAELRAALLVQRPGAFRYGSIT